MCSFFFVFSQKTADELRISDWSSDVCCSDLRQQAIAADARSIAQVLNRGGPSLVYATELFNSVITRQANLRYLTEAAVYDSQGRMLARHQDFLMAFNPDIPELAYDRDRTVGTVVVTCAEEHTGRASVRQQHAPHAFTSVRPLV